MQRFSGNRTVCGLLLACVLVHASGAGSVEKLDGSEIDPLSEGKGQPAVLIFVRTDCPISNRYAPRIQELERAFGSQARFWLVYPGQTQTSAAIQEQLNYFGYHMRAVRDTKSFLVKVAGVQVTPEAAVFSASKQLLYHGRIDNLYEGLGQARTMANSHELRDAIEAAIRGKAPAVSKTAAVGCSLADLE